MSRGRSGICVWSMGGAVNSQPAGLRLHTQWGYGVDVGDDYHGLPNDPLPRGDI